MSLQSFDTFLAQPGWISSFYVCGVLLLIRCFPSHAYPHLQPPPPTHGVLANDEAPDDSAPLLGPQGFVRGVTPLDLGLTLNLNI